MNEKFPSPNKSILEDQGKLIELTRKLENVYEHRPNIDDFVGAMQGTKHEKNYTKDAIESDKRYITRTRDMIEAENMLSTENEEFKFQLSEMLQTMAVDCINKYWFKECKSIMTSDYDDLHSGIDAVMKHKTGGYLGFAFDFTVSSQDKFIYKKLKIGWEKNIETGIVPEIKYFEDPETHNRGKLKVPKFIIGGSKKDVEEFTQAYLTDNHEVLEKHPFQYLMLMQIEEQLQTIFDYYENKQEDEHLQFARQQYKKIESILRNLKNEIHADEKMHENVDLHEYTKNSIALDTMRRFRITREIKQAQSK